MSTSLMAADQVVTSNGDSGAGTLRQAIIDAGDGDEITFNLSSGNEIITISSELEINESLTIDGSNSVGSGVDITVKVTTPGISTFRVFNINAPGKTINISNITIKGGDVSAGSDIGGGVYIATGTTANFDAVTVSGSKAEIGGGIYNDGQIGNLSYSAISGNTATGFGGGIFNDGLIGNLSYSVISGNTVTMFGGGMFNNDTISNLWNSTISGNTAALIGGGIANSGKITNLSNLTITANTAGWNAGGLANEGIILDFLNSTISGNTADSLGGGVYNNGFIVKLSNSTISGNTAPSGSGGIYNTGLLLIANTIINDGYYFDGAFIIDSGYNVVHTSNVAANAAGGFNNSTSILYNTKHGDAGTGFTSWTQNAAVLSNQNLSLSSTLALNGSTNGTQTLALAGTWSWATIANLLVSVDGASAWSTATTAPNHNNAETITILNSTTVNVGANVSIDQTIINLGGEISVATGTTLEITDGSGADITNNGTLTVNGTIIYNDGTYAHGAGASLTYGSVSTLEYSGNNPLTAGDELIFRFVVDLVVSNTAGVSLNGNASISGNFTVNTGSAFAATSNTITLDGASQTLSGNISFYNLTKSVTTADVLTFGVGNTYAVAGTLTLTGATGNLLSLRSSVGGTQWIINPSGTRTISYLDVQDSRNIDATDIYATNNCTDSGNNTKWAFPPSVTTQAVTGIYATTATGNGNITDLGIPNPTAHGVCWSTTSTPTVSDAHTDKGSASSTGAFTAEITGLSNAPATYYVRAFVTNTSGTYYGNEVSFTTISTPIIQAKNIVFSNIVQTQMTLDWTVGSGAKRAMFVTEVTNGNTTASPVDGTTYYPDAVYGNGSQIGASGWYCVYNGTGTGGLIVTGLSPNTNYRAMVCEYNGPVGNEFYNTTTTTNNHNEVTSVPVSDWAIYIGVLFIGTFLIVRYRKIGFV